MRPAVVCARAETQTAHLRNHWRRAGRRKKVERDWRTDRADGALEVERPFSCEGRSPSVRSTTIGSKMRELGFDSTFREGVSGMQETDAAGMQKGQGLQAGTHGAARTRRKADPSATVSKGPARQDGETLRRTGPARKNTGLVSQRKLFVAGFAKDEQKNSKALSRTGSCP